MRAALVDAPGVIEVVDLADPSPAPDEVLLAVRECGICGTDLHLVAGELGADRFPLIPGHEFWGEIAAVGTDVDRFRVGDQVAVDPSLHCGRCARCRRGQGNMCENWGALGATRHGGWADFVAVPQANLYPLGRSFPLAAAALIEPVACAVRGLQRLDPRADEPVVVFGAGTMGLVLTLLLQSRGVGPVTVIDPIPERRTLAERLTGAQVLASHDLLPERAPWVIEATGNPRAFEQALDAVDRAGSLLVFGVANPAALAQVSPHRIYADELTVVGSMAILRSFAPAVDAVARHADVLAPLVTQRLPLGEISTALDSVRAGTTVKTVVTPTLAGLSW